MSNQTKVIKWFARIIALILFLIGIAFYFGYGNPLPFIHPGYSLGENIGLTLIPIVLAGLLLGWRYEKLGGYMTVLPVLSGLVMNMAAGKTIIPVNLLIVLVPGILYLISGYTLKKKLV